MLLPQSRVINASEREEDFLGYCQVDLQKEREDKMLQYYSLQSGGRKMIE